MFPFIDINMTLKQSIFFSLSEGYGEPNKCTESDLKNPRICPIRGQSNRLSGHPEGPSDQNWDIH